MELFEEIRREYRFGAGTIQGVAKKLGVHRRMVRQALASAIPPERKHRRKQPKLGPVREFIDGILQAISKRRASSGTRRIGSGSGFGQEHPEATSGGSDGAAVRAAAQARAGAGAARDVRAAGL